MYRLVLGDLNQYDELESNVSFLIICFFGISSLILVIVMLNLLIAIISDTYERESAISDITFEKFRLRIFKDIESSLGKDKVRSLIGENTYLITIYNRDPDNFDSMESNTTDRIRQRVEQISKVISIYIISILFSLLIKAINILSLKLMNLSKIYYFTNILLIIIDKL